MFAYLIDNPQSERRAVLEFDALPSRICPERGRQQLFGGCSADLEDLPGVGMASDRMQRSRFQGGECESSMQDWGQYKEDFEGIHRSVFLWRIIGSALT